MKNYIHRLNSAEAMFKLAEAYIIEDHAKETGKVLFQGSEDDFLAERRQLEIMTLKSAVNMDDPGTWASTKLLDAMKFLNGRPLEQVPNLHFMAEQTLQNLNGSADLNVVAVGLANQEIRSACEAWLKDCSVFCTIEDVIEDREMEQEHEAA